MKTPRELLLKHHREAEPRLDAIRRDALAILATAQAESTPMQFVDFFRSLRWHLAGLAAVWLFIAILHLDTGHAPLMAASTPRSKIPPPQIIMAALRENRRQLFEMIEPHSADAESRGFFVPKPRSEAPAETFIA